MTALSQLTRPQVEAVLATAALLFRDPEELAVELFPLLHINPFQERREASSHARTTEIVVVESTVNEPLTPTSYLEITR